MSVPTPPSALNGHCSVIYNNTLYVYTPSTLMSLPLERHGNWSTLAMGVSVSGAACVTADIDVQNKQSALYVVGGTANSSTYSGLQRYLFTDQKWETVTLPEPEMQNLLHHGVAYLKGSSTILVYAGANDGSMDASTSTHTISLTAPDNGTINSFTDQGAPPGISPTLLPWDNDTAVYVGGLPTNTEVFLFSVATGWQTSGVSLAQGIPSNAGLAMILGSDGSKVLEIFNMSASPNIVKFVPLLNANGVPAYAGEPMPSNFPAYNSTFAPQTTRSSFSIAQSDNGIIVISGGSDTEPISMFNQTTNSWVNVDALFNDTKTLQQPLVTTTTSVSTPTATPSSSSTSTTAAAAGGGGSSSTGLIVGATLGGLVGVSALLFILLMVLRWLHGEKKVQKGRPRGYPYARDDKDRLSFQDQGIEPLAQSAVPMARGQVPSAVDSLQMISGTLGNELSSATPIISSNRVLSRPLIEPDRSPLTTNVSSRLDGPQRGTGTARSPNSDDARGDRTTDEGWGKYFQDNTTADIARTLSPRTTLNSDLSEETRSDYRSSVWPQTSGTTSLALGPLPQPKPLGQVLSGSPSTEHLPASGHGSFLHQGQSAKISSADSVSVISDDDDPHDAFSSGIPGGIHEESQWPHPWGARPPSSNYTGSFYQPSVQEAPKPQPGYWNENRSNERGSSGLFHQDYYNNSSRTNANSDMSWLNLHGEK